MTSRSAQEAHRAATPLELFFDLCFVVAVAQASGVLHHDLAEGHFGHAVSSYFFVFFAIWWAWMNFTWFASAYDTDDDYYRLTTLVQIAGALILAAGIPKAFGGDFLIATMGYVVMRLAMVGQWLRAARDDPPRRATALRYAVGVAVVQAGWVLRLAFDQPWYLYIGWALIVAELAVPIWAERAQMTTWHPQHITERYGLFTLIVLGEAVAAATVAIQIAADEVHGVDADLLVLAGAGLVLVFSLWWLYFDRTKQELLRSLRAAIIWGYGHYFIFASTAALGAGLAVAADDLSGSAHMSDLAMGLTVGVPVAVWILWVWWLHACPLLRGSVVAASPVAAALVLAAAWTPAPVPVIAIIMAVLAAVTTWGLRRLDPV